MCFFRMPQADHIRSDEKTLEYLGDRVGSMEAQTLQRHREQDYRYNEVAPRIDAIRFDADGRLWIRRYVMPGDDVKRWTVWDGGRKTFSVELSASETWLDARSNLVLLRVRNSLGEDSAVIRELVVG